MYLIVSPHQKHHKFQLEFDQLFKVLTQLNVSYLTLNYDCVFTTEYFFTKDWFTFHKNNLVAVYPLVSKLRQKERTDLVFDLLEDNKVFVDDVLDFTDAELDNCYLEGYNAVVVDAKAEIALAAVSTKCDEALFIEYCEELEYSPVVFDIDNNVFERTAQVVQIFDDFILFCSAAIKDKKFRKLVVDQLKKTGKEIIYINEKQALQNCTELLQLKGKAILMSERIQNLFTQDQLERISKYGEIISINFTEFETYTKRSIGALFNKIA